MNPLRTASQQVLLATILGCVALWIGLSEAQTAAGGQVADEIRIVALQGTVEIFRGGKRPGVRTQLTNEVLRPGDGLRVETNSRVTLRWSAQSVVSFGALTEIEILPPHKPGAQSGLHLIKGILSFFHRDEPGRIRVITRGAAAGVDGTEFIVAVDTVNNTERTRLWVIDGMVQFTNELDRVLVTNGRQAVVEFGKAPELLTAGFIANNVLQWCFYYPAVLDLRDLPLTAEEQQILGESIAAYRAGDLLAALALYPAGRQPGSDAERVYYAALLLSVGQVEKTEATLAALPAADPSDRLQRLATALRQLIAAVNRQPNPSTVSPQLSTELLASSYYAQSLATDDESLKAALELAKRAATNSPKFGFVWARLAELEFSFGHTVRALEALNKSLTISPRNAQALALKGLLLAAQNKTREAIDWFDRAIAVDSALGNAWLGRGLCKIRLTPSFFSLSPGERAGVRASSLQSAMDDILIAAALEPQRALLRSYLGKAYANGADLTRALHEFDLAKGLDTNDPTPWLYSALLNREENRINTGISELEKSIELNDNRALYRSRFLLDEDRAVRSSSLARMYQDAGMNEVAVREAARAVSYDYANYSSHLFLSDSFNQLRDPTRFNLRYETPWFNELLLANLLSPVGGTPLSQHISQQEYSRLFERNRIGLSTDSSYRSDGQYRELASQFGILGKTAWSLDLDYQHNNGIRPNNELDRIEWYTTIKQQLTPQDSVMLLTKYQDYHSGDNFQYYDPTNARPHFTFDEFQTPIVFGGYHREWRPGIHTLLLAGRLENNQRFSDRAAEQTLLFRHPLLGLFTSDTVNLDVTHRSKFEAFSVEAEQLFDNEWQTMVVGARLQEGDFDTRSTMTNPSAFTNEFPDPAADVRAVEDFQRVSAYVYETWKLPARLRLTAGLTYEHLRFPENFRSPPIQPGEATRERLNPKAAVVWEASPEVTFRGVYARSLGGVSLDESYRLEPTQLGGFSQTFRTLIPESLVGSVAAPDHEICSAALDLKFKTGTYIGLQGELLRSEVRERAGVFDFLLATNPPPRILPANVGRNLNYEERAFTVTLNQLLGDEWAFGAQYRFVRSELETGYPELVQALPASSSLNRADLQRVTLSALYNHSSGFFAQAESQWYFQQNFADAAALRGDSFQQLNVFTGYRFRRQRGDVTLGVLNATDEDYRLNPVTPHAELPRERVFYARLRFRF